MKRKLFLKFLLGIVVLVVLVKFSTTVFIEPWVGRKIQAALNEKNKDYKIEIGKVHILIFTSGLELQNITLCSRKEQQGSRDLNADIASLKFTGINLLKALFKNDIDIREVIISNSTMKGKISLSGEAMPPIIAPVNIRVHKIFFDKINLAIKDSSTAQAYSMKDGALKVYDLQVHREDTLFPALIKQFDFEAEEVLSISADSLYAFKATGINYSAASNVLAVTSFFVHPNYKDYEFTSRYKFQTDRIEAGFSNLRISNFSASGYFQSKNLVCSYVEIGEMDMHVFRDKRKEFRHVNKPAFQDMIYNYPGAISIDSISLVNGNVTYTEHAAEANEPGVITFNEIHAKIYKVTNDTIYKTESTFLEIKGEALLMGKGRMTTLLKGQLFDPQNTFVLNGTLSVLEAKELNPMLEKNAFVYATSGKIDTMNFSFTANNTKATGNMTMLYHGLEVAVKNKHTDDTTAFKERFISLIANKKVMDSNPVPGEDNRKGVIDYERDPEKSLFNYCFKSILSGIKSSLAKKPEELKKNS